MTNSSGSQGHDCYHCKEWIPAGEPHDCWTTTEAALTAHLSDELREAWERLRESAADLGEQRIYASGTCIMFARDTCYAFVRPKKSQLELNIFLGREVYAPQIRRAERRSKTKVAHIVPIMHRDEVEAPVTDWLQEAYSLQDVLTSPRSQASPSASTATTGKKASASAAKLAKSSGPSLRAKNASMVRAKPKAAPPARAKAKDASLPPSKIAKAFVPTPQAKKRSAARAERAHASVSRSRVAKASRSPRGGTR